MNAFSIFRICLVSILLLIAIRTTSEATDYFNNSEMEAAAVNSALKSSMESGYHGSIAIALYYINSDEDNMSEYFAWFNAVNACRVIENSLKIATQPGAKEKLKSDLASVNRIIDTFARNRFKWNKDKTKEQVDISKYILTKKIADLKNVRF